MTPTSINGQKQKAADQQAALPQTGNDEDLALLLLGSSLMAATGLTIIDRKRKHA
ncbi:LPXTG cell wall anchor domain-containing protein [Limosilactobacillus reuteri]|uniref:LPXTG cell wall anchor domain-containing protein n=1 Tax=Limosilactobacillus reuteri TaxID=1598 RepID=UPI003983522B